jgi:transposase
MDDTRPYRRVGEAERIKIISLRENGGTFQSIADELNIDINTAQKIYAKWLKHRTIRDLPKSGRPNKLDDRTRRLLVRNVLKGDVITAHQMATESTTLLQVPISAHTASNVLRDEGLHARHTIPKPLLSEDHARQRLEFARAHKHWTEGNWKQVIFSDECLITAYAINPHTTVWTKDTVGLNPRLVVPAVQGGGSRIMVWGCISKFGFHDLALLEGDVDSEVYITTLTDHLLPVIANYFRGQQVVFQHDGARIHTSHATTEFLQSKRIRVLDWPPHSPDLNIIEHVWHYLKTEIHKMEPALNKDKLWNNTNATMPYMWSPKMTAKISNLYESMPRRIQAIIAADGGNTTY